MEEETMTQPATKKQIRLRLQQAITKFNRIYPGDYSESDTRAVKLLTEVEVLRWVLYVNDTTPKLSSPNNLVDII